MPPQAKEAIKFASRNLLLLRVSLIVLGLMVVMAGVVFFGVTIVNSDENSLITAVGQKQQQLLAFQDTLAEAEELANTIETIDTLIEQEEKFSILLKQLGALMPSGSRLTALSLSNDRTEQVQIVSITDTQSTATTLQNNLANSELFIGADIQNITANLDEEGEPMDYTVIIITAFKESLESQVIEEPAPLPEEDEAEGGAQ